jgi:hypothetical protein
MQGRNEERWIQLCQQAAVEQDPVKTLALVMEINDLLDAKEARLREHHKDGTDCPVYPGQEGRGKHRNPTYIMVLTCMI